MAVRKKASKRTQRKDLGPIRLQLVSDGRGSGTRIVDAVTGRDVAGAFAAKWECTPDGFADLTLSFSLIHARVLPEGKPKPFNKSITPRENKG